MFVIPNQRLGAEQIKILTRRDSIGFLEETVKGQPVRLHQPVWTGYLARDLDRQQALGGTVVEANHTGSPHLGGLCRTAEGNGTRECRLVNYFKFLPEG